MNIEFPKITGEFCAKWYWQGTKGNPKNANYLSARDSEENYLTVGHSESGFSDNKADLKLIESSPELLRKLYFILELALMEDCDDLLPCIRNHAKAGLLAAGCKING